MRDTTKIEKPNQKTPNKKKNSALLKKQNLLSKNQKHKKPSSNLTKGKLLGKADIDKFNPETEEFLGDRRFAK